MSIEFTRLSHICTADIIALNTHPQVLKHMPLGNQLFDEEFCQTWVAGKEQHWEQYGYGIWVFKVDGQFAGWGGLQDESGDADLALVLHPDYWGIGQSVAKKIISETFDVMKLTSVTIHLPLTRLKLAAIFRYGFIQEVIVDFDGVAFQRFRLSHKKTLL